MMQWNRKERQGKVKERQGKGRGKAVNGGARGGGGTPGKMRRLRKTMSNSGTSSFFAMDRGVSW